MTTRSSRVAQDVAAELVQEGHVVRTCSDGANPQPSSCAALRSEACPLDSYPIDVAVGVEGLGDDALANGGLCAIRRRLPLVLVDRPGDPLEPWATASVPRARLSTTIAALDAAELPAHTAVARQTLDEELGRRPRVDAPTEVVVHRRDGGLVVDLSPEAELSRGETEKLAVHIVQRLRSFDPWAKTIDVRSD